MIRYLASYLQPVMMACMLFPFIAGAFTIPFVVRQYVTLVLSFILGCLRR